MLFGTKNKILVVDEDNDLIFLLRRILSDDMYIISQVNYGKECIEEAKSTSPDIIIIDVVMPKLDGIATVLKLRSTEETKSIPIIMCKNMRDAEDENLSRDLGIADYAKKTPRMDDLVTKIKRIFNQ
ncbi:MAG: two-component system response regulator [bacterium]